VEEGAPVAIDDSYMRKERSLKEWRNYFTISTRKTGLNISAYLRSSKIVYLPDMMGNTQVGTVNKEAFPEDTIVLCSKRLFAKLSEENKYSTIRAFLLDRVLFTEEEQEYLKAVLKRDRVYYLEKFIIAEDQTALFECLKILSSKKALEECFEITERMSKSHMNFTLLEYSATQAQKSTAKKKAGASVQDN
jgi:hypothetical protein